MSTIRVQCPNPACQSSFSLAPDETIPFRNCPQCGAALTDAARPVSHDHGNTRLPTLAEGSTFAGRYAIVRLLGRGGMGEVYLAQDNELHRRVALKIPLLAGDVAEFRQRFRREARSAARLQHPNICQVFDVGEHQGQPYLTMAYVDGITLGEYLKRTGQPFPPDRAARLVRMLARALAKAHEAGVIHRDLKPGNIMLTREGRPMVMDFGLARCEDAADSLHTRAGAMMGTPAYMPIEQFRGDTSAIGPRTDVYSLGVILYQLLTGRLPHVGNSSTIFEQLLTNSEPPAPSALCPGLDPRCDAICRKAMARDAVNRHASMSELATELEGLLAAKPPGRSSGELTLVDPESLPAPEPEPTEPVGGGWRDSWHWLFALAFTLLAVLGVVIHVATDTGTVTITGTDPDMEVRIDGKEIRIERPGDPITLRVGTHDLLIMRGDLRVKGQSFEIRRSQETPLRVEFTPESGRVGIAQRQTPSRPGSEREDDPPPISKPAEAKGEKVESGRVGTAHRQTPPRPESKRDDDPPASPKPAEAPKSQEKPAARIAVSVTPPPPAPVVDPPAKAEPKAAPEDPPKPRTMSAGTRTPEEREDNALKLVLCWCPAGSFKMGSPTSEPGRGKDDETQVDVTLSQGFWMGKYEVTQDQWQRVMGTTLAQQKAKDGVGDVVGEGPNHPMYFVNHTEAEEFCRKLTESERAAGRLGADWEYRLPTEAQWEYACRAGTTTATAFGDQLSSTQANFDGNYPYNGAKEGRNEGATVPVGKYPGNSWGLHDMHGNVWEWCRDGYETKLPGGVDPGGPGGALRRVGRGGGWYSYGGVNCRSANRDRNNPENRNNFLGFRVAAVPKGAKNK